MSLVPMATLMRRGLLRAPWEPLLALMHSEHTLDRSLDSWRLLRIAPGGPHLWSALSAALGAPLDAPPPVFCSSASISVPVLVAPREGALFVFLLFDNSFYLFMAVLSLHCFSVLVFQLQ